ncbi:Phosphoribosylglycinamide formyltransferase [Caulifigura coniformis]|uniref:phosphoribosylglycinamide formyltransferase 1 n=1 Tax=Caulifigura coniformis TaxID=2527983 RepID=A0A517SL42_9PLAN|nr:phosphoribosylglycinamide formyltransferase [Caulifigura coniformis]QDT56843.1 Phosphoribosylglycinamide formyltransferase [Caulifigura coniformis]
MSDSTVRSEALRVGVLISGSGTTLVNFLKEREAGRLPIEIPIVIADRECGGISKCIQAGLACEVLPRRTFENTAEFSRAIFDRMRAAKVDLVTLAGFLARVDVPDDFHQRVMNIHPSLIPAFCGKGMYGHFVHEAVIARGCKVSGCTVHFADSEYDHGPIISQKCVPVIDGDTPDILAARVFEAECAAYPEAIRRFAAARR